MIEPWILLILAAISCTAGFAWLALSINVHWQQVMHSANTPDEKTRPAPASDRPCRPLHERRERDAWWSRLP